ncbi:uncharacterized protein LOC103144061 [Poecilia formosa]|uniref:uncharacterized protein LOC103144061 n=1 Tax=Poecilia formosa TaxID=48698 RepID=UPI000443D920|nr:PREDICTED: uncharacterized protein LOC103144061 [Poecilia formosa]
MRRSCDSRPCQSQRFSQRLLCVWQLACSPCCGMKAKWWSCVLALLCMPAEVMPNTRTAPHRPLTISNVWINSSLEIKCSAPQRNPFSLSLKRRFLGDEQILYLHFDNEFPKNTTTNTFENRISITKEQLDEGLRYKFKLSLLELKDTDLYYCIWDYIEESYNNFNLESDGIVIIVREGGPEKACSVRTVDLTLICLSIVAFTSIFLMFICLMIVRCRRFKKNFTPFRGYAPPLPPRPSRPSQPPRPNQPRNIYMHQQQTVDQCPYMMTSTHDYGIFGNL